MVKCTNGISCIRVNCRDQLFLQGSYWTYLLDLVTGCGELLIFGVFIEFHIM